MTKDFDSWNKRKKTLDDRDNTLFFREGEVWWVHLGLNIGFEMDGKGDDFTRPVLVVKKYNQFSFLALPLSTSLKLNQYRVSIGNIAGRESVAILSQLRNIDSKRLVNRVGCVTPDLLETLKEKTSQVNFD